MYTLPKKPLIIPHPLWILKKLPLVLLLFLSFIEIGCSYHYQQGKELELEKRWEEAAIEYRMAFVADPKDEDIIAALERANKQVAQDNMLRYREYLEQKQYKKAYRRLEAATLQDPSLQEAQKELKLWLKVLLAGKVEFEFDRLQSNIQLADEMQLQFLINTPTGKILTATISNESGLFFVEDLVYQQLTSTLTQYSVNSIGLKVSRKTSSGFNRKNFNKFINFRGIAADNVSGNLQEDSEVVNNVLAHRPLLKTTSEVSEEPWIPPRLVRYQIALEGNKVQVLSESKRLEFVPEVLYVNRDQRRIFVDFGAYHLKMESQSRQWSIQRQNYQTTEDDYFYLFVKNLALNPYFFYREGAYQYVLAP